MADVLVKSSLVKKYIAKADGLRTSGDVPQALTEVIEKILDKVGQVTKDAKRKTVQGPDIWEAAKLLEFDAD